MKDAFLIDVIGWLGSGMVLLAYTLSLNGKLPITGITYPALNIFGGVFCILNTAYYGAYPSSFANVVWVGIAVFALYNKFQMVRKLNRSKKY